MKEDVSGFQVMSGLFHTLVKQFHFYCIPLDKKLRYTPPLEYFQIIYPQTKYYDPSKKQKKIMPGESKTIYHHEYMLLLIKI